MSDILVAIAPNGELVTLRPVYFRTPAEDAFTNVNRYHIYVEVVGDEPVGYALDSREGARMFGPGILKLVEVIGVL